MDQTQTLKLLKRGKTAWNDWAANLTQSRLDLEKAGASLDDWFDKAHVDFKGYHFEERADFSDYVFPGPSLFTQAVFFDGAMFIGAKFKSDARFSGVKFGEVWFNGTEFAGNAWFDPARCDQKAATPTHFKSASFETAHFSRIADFAGANFDGPAFFGQTTFMDMAQFPGTHFKHQASFVQTQFKGYTNFAGAKFTFKKCPAAFVALNCERAFTLKDAKFELAPDFDQAHFSEAPRLDNLAVSIPGFLESLRTTGSPDLAARYRALKRLAIQGHDHEREQIYFAGELRSLRGDPDRPWPNLLNVIRKGKPVWPRGARYWLGIFYELLSDFGRSIVRPTVWWTIATVLFATTYFGRHILLAVPDCIDGRGSPLRSAIYLAIRKGLIFPGLSQDQKLDRAYACLYGATKLSEEGRVIPVIPDSVAYLGIAQSLISAVLIFLALLAVRNYFRIK